MDERPSVVQIFNQVHLEPIPDKHFLNLFYAMFFCSFCKDYDLCEVCEKKEGIHDPTHFFAKLRNHVPGIGRKNGEMVPVLKKFVYKMTLKEEYKNEKKEEKRKDKDERKEKKKEKDERKEKKKEKMLAKAARKDEKEKRELKRRTKKEWRQL